MFQVRYVTIIVLCCFTVIYGNVVRNEDICGTHNGRRLYLELGEKGILYAKNISFIKNSPRQQSSRIYATNSSHDQCSLELVTCPSCVIIVTFKNLALSHHCGDGGVMMDNPCRCDYVWISEPPYEDVSGTPYCGLYSPIMYRSSTRTLSITLLYSQSHKHAFTLEYTAERNRLHLKGTEMMTAVTKGLNSTGGGILTSPFFPARYPRDLGLEYIITCPSEAPSCRIRILFSDFQLATVSIMEFYDWNGQRLDVSSGARFRPPVIVSSGPSLLIRFYANGGTGLGYKAFYSFVIGHLYDKSIQPITDCGGYVENLGGAITMMDMVGQGVKTYDCVWLIRPPKNFLHMKTHMYLKVVAFADMAGNTELTIKQGPTSALLPLEVLRHPVSQLQPPRHREHIAPVTSGFHVSLRGTFGPTSHLAIAYTAFSYMDCFTGSDFLCQNHRCIPSQLNCDGFDHCGDNSDEPATCFRDWDVEPRDRKWHTNKANYYFPKIDRYPDLKTATLVFVASSLGLIVLISALIILLYRMGARARQQRELQSRLQTISELLDGARIDEISVTDDPPVYEAPPGYDEVVKLSLESDVVGRKKRRSFSRESRNRNSPSRCSHEQEAQSSMCLEGASTSRGSQTTPTTSSTARNSRVPESPPPPYVTPPGSIGRSLHISDIPSSSSGSAEINDSVGIRKCRARRAWLRTSCEFSRSQQQNDDKLRQMKDSSCSSIDAEVLGAYLQDYIASCSSCTIDCSASQPNNSQSASSDIKGESSQVIREEHVGQGEDEEHHRVDDVVGNSQNGSTDGCSCEGACGCANNQIVLIDESTINQNPQINEVTMNDEDFEQATVSVESGRKQTNGENGDEEESVSPKKHAIIRLLGSSCSRHSRSSSISNVNSTGISTATSTPYSTLGRSFRKVSVCSRDSYATKISTISVCNSCEKLHDEFQFVSEAASVIGATNPSTMANTPISTPKIINLQRRRVRRYSSCDLESFYESIKVLDSYLARRCLSSNQPPRRQSTIAVMLFGTPEHSGRRLTGISRSADGTIRTRTRIWRSNDDTLFN
ncbi:PREDICTED: uncharacterized protein LOC106789207 isoform X2 [Polistes canadensis]|uniref:uncharacterized protein LOC106789207 isoform X2 n=1 Tax=Polistes canadensis TaxID=91411 RepID=UPI000718C372|nr:PREDICTED: uncharacterized protein LOC106789207 isoform X2 [Polistes canadensis]